MTARRDFNPFIETLTYEEVAFPVGPAEGTARAGRERTGIRMTVEEASAPLPKGIDDRRKARRWINQKEGTS